MEIPRELVEQFARGNGAIFVGASLSQAAGLPSWGEVIGELAVALEDCPPDLDYRDIAQYYEIEFGRQRLIQALRERMDRFNISPAPVHIELVKTPVSAIFTTNYDDLLEQALHSVKHPFAIVVGNVDTSFWSNDRLQLVKLHGDLSQPDTITITSEDFERFSTQRSALARLLATTFQTQTVLFLGYSATDPILRQILTQIRDEGGRFARNLYTVQFGLPRLSVKGLERRGLRVIDLDEHSGVAAQNIVLQEWLLAFTLQIEAEKMKLTPKTSIDFQSAADILTGEIQIWLNAMGYSVISQSGDNRHIDLNARLQRGLEDQHVLVRCLAGEITVKHLQALLNDLDIQKIPKGWVVSDRRVPPSSQEFADANDLVRPFSLTDFVTQIFGPYFDKLHQQVEASEIPKYYVNLACYRRVLDSQGGEIGRDHYDIIDDYVDDWLKARDANHLSMLGEFGSGKTWFCQHYAYRQLERYLKDPVHERLPILITLRDYLKQVEVGSLIRKLLDEQGVHLGDGFEAFEELNRQGKLLLIFDGFDEMAVKVDYQLVVDYFWELAKVVVPGSKALLTCRTPYFRYATEAEKVMRGEELGRKMIVIQPPQFEVVYLEPLTDKQIREVVTIRYGTDIAQIILGNRDLTELARQPVLIEILMKALPDIQPNMVINRSSVYQLAVDQWLERDIGAERTFMNKWDKLFFMIELAWEMFSTDNLKIHYKALPQRINSHFGLEQLDEKDHYDYDIRTKSFLRRDAMGYYEFAHKSLVEYFVAIKLAADLGVTAPEFLSNISKDELSQPLFDLSELKSTFGAQSLTAIPEIRDFLVGMTAHPARLWTVIEKTREETFENVGYIGGNAATLLRLMKTVYDGRDLSRTVLVGADLRGGKFVGTNFNSADLRNTLMSGASFRRSDLSGSDLRGAKLQGASFVGSKLKNIITDEETQLDPNYLSPDKNQKRKGLHKREKKRFIKQGPRYSRDRNPPPMMRKRKK